LVLKINYRGYIKRKRKEKEKENKLNKPIIITIITIT
jgi:hypothetical protein